MKEIKNEKNMRNIFTNKDNSIYREDNYNNININVNFNNKDNNISPENFNKNNNNIYKDFSINNKSNKNSKDSITFRNSVSSENTQKIINNSQKNNNNNIIDNNKDDSEIYEINEDLQEIDELKNFINNNDNNENNSSNTFTISNISNSNMKNINNLFYSKESPSNYEDISTRSKKVNQSLIELIKGNSTIEKLNDSESKAYNNKNDKNNNTGKDMDLSILFKSSNKKNINPQGQEDFTKYDFTYMNGEKKNNINLNKHVNIIPDRKNNIDRNEKLYIYENKKLTNNNGFYDFNNQLKLKSIFDDPKYNFAKNNYNINRKVHVSNFFNNIKKKK